MQFVNNRLHVYVGWLLLLMTSASPAKQVPGVKDAPPPIQLETVLQAPSGSHIDWQALKGNVVVLEFWSTSCGPCVGAISHLNELVDTFQNRGVVFLSITDEDEPTIKEFLANKPIHGWIGLNPSRSASKAFGVDRIPLTVIVGADGNIAAITYPTDVKNQHLENILNGKESGLPIISIDPQQQFRPGTIPDAKSADDSIFCQIVIRRSNGKLRGGLSGAAGKNEFGRVFGSTRLGVTFEDILVDAYNVTPAHLVIETPLPEGRFDVFAKIPYDSLNQWESISPRLIEATFGVKCSHEHRELDSYMLAVKKKGMKALQPTVTPHAYSANIGPGNFDAINTSMKTLIGGLETYLHKPVFDDTHLTGGYDFQLSWKGTQESPNPVALVEAVRDQLGLELTEVKKSVEVVVVSRLGKPKK